MTLSQFADTADRLVASVTDGLTLTEACSRAGVAYDTARNWVSAGRREPSGKYGAFAAALDAARDSEGQHQEPGPIESEVHALLSDRRLAAEERLAAVQARAFARAMDVLASTRGGSSGMAMVAVSRRLDECIDGLRLQPKDALTEIRERRSARIAATRQRLA